MFDLARSGVPWHERERRSGVQAWQKKIRDREAELDPRPVYCALDECEVRPISNAAARRIIARYEWLGHMRGPVFACYGLVGPRGRVLGVAVFGNTPNPRSADMCGRENSNLAVCLRRGACVHDAPTNAASFLIAGATRLAARDRGWRIFHAYADEQAGEVGTVYQACNWLYMGQFHGIPTFLRPGAVDPIDLRSLKEVHDLTIRTAKDAGWIEVPSPARHRYVHFEGSRTERRHLRAALRYPVLPYPKRQESETAEATLDG